MSDITTLGLGLLGGNEILLALKKIGFDKDRINGPGGKCELIDNGEGASALESPEDCFVRKVYEELVIRVDPGDLQRVAVIDFSFEGELKFTCYVFTFRKWRGDPTETEEMAPRIYKYDKIPYPEMWPGDIRWLSLVLAGKTGRCKINFNKEKDKVLSFDWADADQYDLY